MQPWLMNLEELVAGTRGKVLSQMDRKFFGVGTDTRADLTGKIFVALKGDSFDAHDFLDQAVARGAKALLVHRMPDKMGTLLDGVTVVQVDDTLLALQSLAKYWRRKMKAKVLAITGTNGKTTSKEFALQLMQPYRRVQASKGSFNNHWGVPLSLLSIDANHDVALIEMGMNHPGELETLCQMAEPDAVVVTMVGRGHLQGLGSIEGVARAKAEIYEAAPAKSTRIYNLSNPWTRAMYEANQEISDGQVLTFAELGPTEPVELTSADVSMKVLAMDRESLEVAGGIQGESGQIKVYVFGKQNLNNLMVAASLGLAAGLSPKEIWDGLKQCKMVWGRNQWVQLQSGGRVLFDGYNANPESMKAALENFHQLPVPEGGRKFVVLGEMLELGEQAHELHRDLAAQLANIQFDGVYFFGPSSAVVEAQLQAAGIKKNLYISSTYKEGLASELLPVLDANDVVLVKASRGMRLERFLMDLNPVDFVPKS